MRACTVITRSFLAHARVLADSLREHDPGSSLVALVIDGEDGGFDSEDEPFEVILPADLGCDAFERLAARYDALELSMALKPTLLRQQLRESPVITYLDADIQIHASIARLGDLGERHGVVVTPHTVSPLPQDGRTPSQLDILRAGGFNLGYLSLARRPEVERLLDGWAEHLRRHGRVDPSSPHSAGQRWFDLAPGFVDGLHVLREPGSHVAYWNLHDHRLERVDGRYEVDGRPLMFFHFSGFDPSRPDVLSRHGTRVRTDDRPDLRRLCSEYAAALYARGYEQVRELSYRYDTAADGSSLTSLMRTLFAAGEESGALLDSPFNADGCRALMEWAGQPDPEQPSLNRALGAIFASRADLRALFPEPAGRSHDPLLAWMRSNGPTEYRLDARLLADPAAPDPTGGRSAGVPARLRGSESRPPVVTVRGTPGAPPGAPPGVNVVGYFNAELGLGEAARQLVSAFDAAAVPVLPIADGVASLSRQGHAFEELPLDAAGYPITVLCATADVLPRFAEHAGAEFFSDRHTVGLMFWELATPPTGWEEAFGVIDEVWAPTRHIAEAVRAVAPIPVHQIRLPIEAPAPTRSVRADLGLSDAFQFLFVFDYFSVVERKNPLGVVAAYRLAFPRGDEGATLVLKSINHDHDPGHHAQLRAAVRDRPDITLLDFYVSAGEKNGLIADCDCYVSLHRAEGFGLTLAEAMYQSRPVIATGYSGNLDFMTDANSILVDHTMVPIGNVTAQYLAEAEWADPDLGQAATAMRQLFENPDRARALGARAGESIRATHSAAVAGRLLLERVTEISRQRPLPAAASVVEPLLRPTLEAEAPTPDPTGSLGARFGMAIQHVFAPFTARQRSVDERLTSSLEALDRRLLTLSAAQRDLQAAQLARARAQRRDPGA